jgi:hypothetical protein
MTTVTWVKYKEYAGCKIAGTVPVPKPTSNCHMDRAFYLTAMIESPTYGSVQSYDGAAMSGGPLHNIAVQPRNLVQGSLFALLRHIETNTTHPAELLDLWAAYSEQGWAVTQNAVLKSKRTGNPVSGAEIRDTFTPHDGNVPSSGPQWETAQRWALLHHRLFAAPATFDAQKQYAINWLLQTQKDVESLFYQGRDPRTLTDLSPEEDLAMCVYHCYSVNAPAPARDELVKTLNESKKGKPFAIALLSHLAANTFGNWEVRYTRTRNAALASGLWPKNLFAGTSAIFPMR